MQISQEDSTVLPLGGEDMYIFFALSCKVVYKSFYGLVVTISLPHTMDSFYLCRT